MLDAKRTAYLIPPGGMGEGCVRQPQATLVVGAVLVVGRLLLAGRVGRAGGDSDDNDTSGH